MSAQEMDALMRLAAAAEEGRAEFFAALDARTPPAPDSDDL